MKSSTRKFMGACGILKDVSSKEVFFEEVGKLIPLIQEELDELKESYNLQYVQGVLDDYVDIQVYAHQLESLLERLGCDVIGAKQAVAENNSLKYTTSGALVMRWLNEHDNNFSQLKEDNPYYISTNEYEGEIYYCLKKRATDKVGKFVGFPKLNLDNYTPKEYGGNL